MSSPTSSISFDSSDADLRALLHTNTLAPSTSSSETSDELSRDGTITVESPPHRRDSNSNGIPQSAVFAMADQLLLSMGIQSSSSMSSVQRPVDDDVTLMTPKELQQLKGRLETVVAFAVKATQICPNLKRRCIGCPQLVSLLAHTSATIFLRCRKQHNIVKSFPWMCLAVTSVTLGAKHLYQDAMAWSDDHEDFTQHSFVRALAAQSTYTTLRYLTPRSMATLEVHIIMSARLVGSACPAAVAELAWGLHSKARLMLEQSSISSNDTSSSDDEGEPAAFYPRSAGSVSEALLAQAASVEAMLACQQVGTRSATDVALLRQRAVLSAFATQ